MCLLKSNSQRFIKFNFVDNSLCEEQHFLIQVPGMNITWIPQRVVVSFLVQHNHLTRPEPLLQWALTLKKIKIKEKLFNLA